jgi:hypothetical protein
MFQGIQQSLRFGQLRISLEGLPVKIVSTWKWGCGPRLEQKYRFGCAYPLRQIAG